MDGIFTTDNIIIFIQSLGIVIGALIGSFFYTVLGKGQNRFEFFRRRSFRALVRLRAMHNEIHTLFAYKKAREDLLQAIALLDDFNAYQGDDFLSKKHTKETLTRHTGKNIKDDRVIHELKHIVDIHEKTLNKINGKIDIENELFKELKKHGQFNEAAEPTSSYSGFEVMDDEINKRLKTIFRENYLSKRDISKTDTEASIFKLDKYDDIVIQSNNLSYMDLDTAHGSALVEISKKLDRISEVIND